MAGHLKKPVKWILNPKKLDPVELQLWEAMAAIEPFGHEVEYLVKLLAAALKKPDQWEDLRPVDCIIKDNPFEQINLGAARLKVAGSFQAIADQLKAVKRQQKRK